jgi:anti-sigma factor (TIGR02949 family)
MNPKDNMCFKVVEKIPLYLDGEMSEFEIPIFLEHVEHCHKCLEHYQIEKSFKEIVRQKCERKCVNAQLVGAIKNKISMLLAKG